MAAPEVQIKGGAESVKLRNPVNVALLDFFTVGIYGLFWYFYVNREMVRLGRARGTIELGENATTSLLALIPGGFILVPALISMWNTPKRVQAAQRLAGMPEGTGLNPVLAFILFLVFFPAGAWYVQSELNKVWATETEGGMPALPPQAAAAPPPAPAPPAEPAAPQEAPPPPPAQGS